jgi:tRNA-modifying protein YgfZ
MQMSLTLQRSASSGESIAELARARSGSVLAELAHFGMLRFAGADAAAFLQGQLTCDMEGLAPGSATLGAWCSPKGRMLASFLLWRSGQDFSMLLPRDILPSIQKRISMFVLRSKVTISDASPSATILGAAGPKAAEAARLATPGQEAIGLKDGRFVLVLDAAVAAPLRQQLQVLLEPVGAQVWRWLDIRAGLPWVTTATQDQLVPQMANLDFLGGVSFSKGCYTGQEVVARTQHLGKLKRRMFLANIGAPAAAGDGLYSEGLGAQANGVIVNAEASPDGGHDVLAVVQSESREKSVVHLNSLDGPPLRFLPLPYSAA